MNLKVNNAQHINQLSQDVVRMSNASHPMLEETYDRFVKVGVDTPSYTQMTLKKAEYDSYIKAAKDLANEEIGVNDYINRIKRTRTTLAKLDTSETGKKLYSAMKEVYPKTALKRIAVLSGLSEGHAKFEHCSTGKTIKKNVYRFLKLINRG